MLIESIAVLNYRSFGNTKNVLQVNPGITTIVGMNESGKSNLIEALSKIDLVNGITEDVSAYRNRINIKSIRPDSQVYTAPFDVRLFGDDSCTVQPDIAVICNREILADKGCSGAPDWIIEITSASNARHNYVTKMVQYQKAGVREYWIADP